MHSEPLKKLCRSDRTHSFNQSGYNSSQLSFYEAVEQVHIATDPSVLYVQSIWSVVITWAKGIQ